MPKQTAKNKNNIAKNTEQNAEKKFIEEINQANNFANLKRKNFTSVTPRKLALNPLIFELKDSALAFVLLLSKKFKISSR